MIRVFPRKTKATPDDNNVRIGGPRLWDRGEGEDVLISCTFTWDRNRCFALARQWKDAGYRPKIGGPAFGDPGGEFQPGQFIRQGMTITSRGCNNTGCWFCTVPQREGKIRELEIKDGNNIFDNNILQCSDWHIRAVFEMLDRQKMPAKFTGGIEAASLKSWHVELISNLKRKPEILYFAYDTPNDKDPLIEAAELMHDAGFKNRRMGCYVLVGYPKDTIEAATKRVQLCVDLDMMPYAMYYNNEKKQLSREWKDFQFNYIRPQQTRRIHKGQFGRFFKNN